MADPIFIPRTRQARILEMLGLKGEPVTEILMDPEHAIVTRIQVDLNGHARFDQNGDPVTETVEITFTDEIDPMNASTVYQDKE